MKFSLKAVADTNERPFPCPDCHMHFPRADVRTKHMKDSHGPKAAIQNLPPSNTVTRSSVSSKERAKLACDECRRRKLRCDNLHPCKSCRTKRLQCHVSKSSKPPGRPRHNTLEAPDDESVHSHLTAAFEISSSSMPWDLGAPSPVDASMSLIADVDESHAPTNLAGALPLSTFSQTENSMHIQQGPLQEPLLESSIQVQINSSEPLPLDVTATVDPMWGGVELGDDSWELPPLVGYSGFKQLISDKRDRASMAGSKPLTSSLSMMMSGLMIL